MGTTLTPVVPVGSPESGWTLSSAAVYTSGAAAPVSRKMRVLPRCEVGSMAGWPLEVADTNTRRKLTPPSSLRYTSDESMAKTVGSAGQLGGSATWNDCGMDWVVSGFHVEPESSLRHSEAQGLCTQLYAAAKTTWSRA